MIRARRRNRSDHRVHPAGNPGANLQPISHRCYLWEVAFEWELTTETINLPLGCLQGGAGREECEVRHMLYSGDTTSRRMAGLGIQRWFDLTLRVRRGLVLHPLLPHLLCEMPGLKGG